MSQLKQACGTLTNDNTEKAELLNKYFASFLELKGQGQGHYQNSVIEILQMHYQQSNYLKILRKPSQN